MKNSTFSCFGMKQQLLLAFLIFTGQAAIAGDTEGYYWFRNHVTAYPTGAGQVYGTYSSEDYDYDEETGTYTPHDDLFTDEVMVQTCDDSPDASFHVFNKPAEGYHFNGWYSLNENGELGRLLTIDDNVLSGEPLFRPSDLDYYHSYDNEIEYYDEAPINEIAGVFGRVAYTFSIDNMDDAIATYSKYDFEDPEMALNFAVFISMDSLHLCISNPANEIGDDLVLHTEQEYIYYTSNGYEEDNMVEFFRIVFAGWTDTNGNNYESVPLEVNVTGKETYTAHYNIILNEDYLGGIYTSVREINARRSNSSATTYNLNGCAVRPRLQQGRIYIRDGKKYLISREKSVQ